MDFLSGKTGWLHERNLLFPFGLLFVVLVLTAFRISGTSVGAYHQMMYGPATPDKNLLYGSPQAIRSDEWLVNTPLTISQSHFGLPKVNPSVGTGLDAAVLLDIPTRDWSEIFKPQNWAFFVLPLEHAFAFRWWIEAWLLICGAYFFSLLLLPKQRLLAALLSVSFFFSPFIQWWYQTATLAPLYGALFIILIFAALLKATKLHQQVLWGGLLGYVLTCFALILYPPFQIACAFVVVAVCFGLLMEHKQWSWQSMLRALVPVFGAIILAALMVLGFFVSHFATVHLIENTVYPGHRSVPSGGYSIAHLLDGGFDRELQYINKASNYVGNQSEESNFIFIWPFLIVPYLLLVYRGWKNSRKIDYFGIAVVVVLAIFLARLLLPMPDFVSKILLLSAIPHNRLLIGLGLLNFVFLVVFVRKIREHKFSERVALCVGVLAMTFQFVLGWVIRKGYPHYLTSWRLILLVGVCVGVMVFLFMRRQAVAAAALLLLFSFWSTHHVNPLYVGLGELTSSKIEQVAGQQPGSQSSGWVFVGSVALTGILQAYGLHSYSGTIPYPQPAYVKQLQLPADKASIYNRYAHVVFDPELTAIKLDGFDTYSIPYHPCDATMSGSIRYIVSQSKFADSCTRLKGTASYPNLTLYVYEVK